MAKVVLQNVHVGRVFDVRGSTSGASVEERYQDRNGNDRVTRYALFFDEAHGLNVGDVINVEGLLSASVDNYVKQDGSAGQSVSLKVNKPKVSTSGDASKGVAQLEQMANEIFTADGAPF